MKNESQQTAVRNHYRKLAADYHLRANRTCEAAYAGLLTRYFAGCDSILELGSGSSNLLSQLNSSTAVACDLSYEMLQSRKKDTHRVVSAAEKLPFQNETFDGVFLINLLEHVENVEWILSESSRVLKQGGTWLTVTPNGDWEFWLDLAERMHLKISEGPHSFLTPSQLSAQLNPWFESVEHKTFLTLPAGPAALSTWVDRVTFSSSFGWGFFQYVVARKRTR